MSCRFEFWLVQLSLVAVTCWIVVCCFGTSELLLVEWSRVELSLVESLLVE